MVKNPRECGNVPINPWKKRRNASQVLVRDAREIVCLIKCSKETVA